jgi:hypothetical protein
LIRRKALLVAGSHRNEAKANPCIMGRIVFYRRLPPLGEHKYRFEIAQEFLIPGVCFIWVAPLNLDGEDSNGREGFVVSYQGSNAEMQLPSGGFVCLERDESGQYALTGLFVPPGEALPSPDDVFGVRRPRLESRWLRRCRLLLRERREWR